MLTTTKDRHDFVRAEGEFEDKPGTSEYRDCGVGQKQIGQPAYEAVTSWSDGVAQTQEMGPLSPRRIATNKLSRTHGEKVEYSRLLPFLSLETVIQLLRMSRSLEIIVAVQDQNQYSSMCYLRTEDIETCQGSTRSRRFTPR